MQEINPNIQQPQKQVYGASGQDVRSAVNNNTVVKTSPEQKDEFRKIAMTPILGAGIYYGMKKFNNGCSRDYETKSILGKAERFGDKVAKWKIFDNSFVNNLVEKSIKYKDNSYSYLRRNSAIFRAFLRPTKPQVGMVVMQSSGPVAEIAKNAGDEMWKIVEKDEDLTRVNAYGFATKEEMQDCIKNAHEKKNIDKILNALELKGEAVESGEIGGKIPWSNKFTSDKKHLYLTDIFKGEWAKDLFGKKFSYSEYANKIKALRGNGTVATTRLGKFMPRAMIRGLEGLTQTSTGGAIAAIMGAYFLADAVNNTIKADGFNEKRKALPENVIYLAGWILTMPISIRLMHNVGGFKYIGVKSVNKYRKALYEFNAKASGMKVDGNKFVKLSEEELEKLGGRFQSKDEYKAAKKALKAILKGESKWYHQPLKWAGRVMSVGLEQMRPYVAKDANGAVKALKNSKFFLKQGAGYPVRLLTFAMVTSPFFAKIGAKVSHIFFGKPKVSVLDEGKTDETKQKADPAQNTQFIGQPAANQTQNGKNAVPQDPQAAPQAPVQQPQQQAPAPQAQQQPQQPQQQAQPAQQQPPAQNQANQQPNAQPQQPQQPQKQRYIPSSAPVQVAAYTPSNEDNAKVNNAMSKFDKVANSAESYTKLG